MSIRTDNELNKLNFESVPRPKGCQNSAYRPPAQPSVCLWIGCHLKAGFASVSLKISQLNKLQPSHSTPRIACLGKNLDSWQGVQDMVGDGPYRTRDPFCCFWMTRNVKRGPEATIWTVDPSGRSTNLLIWMVLTCRSICCFCPF